MLMVRGVEIHSRYGKADEYELMQDAVLAMGPLAGLLRSIHCDSKAGAAYSGVLREWAPGTARAALLALEEAILQHGLGHNGITLATDNGTMFGDDTRCV
jgi:hypothetical protein